MFALPTTTMMVAFLALALERFLCFAGPLRKLVGHPAQWLDRFTGIFTMLLPSRQTAKSHAALKGAMFCAVASSASLALALVPNTWLRPLPYALCWNAMLAIRFLQQYATRMRARAVAAALSKGNLDEAESAVAIIDQGSVAPETRAQAVCRTVEDMIWNLSTGIVTPAFWLALFGLPGIVTIAALATVERHASAALLATAAPVWALLAAGRFLPCKIAGLLVTGAASMVSPSAGARALEHILADARFNRTRDANWPRAAFAGVLSIRLGGPEVPGQMQRTDYWIGNGARDAEEADLRASLRLLATKPTLFTVLAGQAAAFG